MEGKIIDHSDGISILQIKRSGSFIDQYCPFAAPNSKCGDWCPQFGEPQTYPVETYLTICQNRVLSFTELKDLRS